MMFSSSKPYGTNCNFFLNSVSSSCHEHFETYYKYLFWNNFTFRGILSSDIFNYVFPIFYFFGKALELETVSPLPQLFLLLREWL